jgi:enoyl-CoA hydratase/carnithine racemase
MLRDYYLPTLQLLREFPKPTVCSVQGACIARGSAWR